MNINIFYYGNLTIITLLLKPILQLFVAIRIITNSLVCHLIDFIMWILPFISFHFLPSFYATAILIRTRICHAFVLLIMLSILLECSFYHSPLVWLIFSNPLKIPSLLALSHCKTDYLLFFFLRINYHYCILQHIPLNMYIYTYIYIHQTVSFLMAQELCLNYICMLLSHKVPRIF